MGREKTRIVSFAEAEVKEKQAESSLHKAIRANFQTQLIPINT